MNATPKSAPLPARSPSTPPAVVNEDARPLAEGVSTREITDERKAELLVLADRCEREDPR